MRVFDDVVPISVKCPHCGVISISDLYNNREVWRLMNQATDTMFINTKCGHVFELSKVAVLDRNGLPVKPMSRQTIGVKRYALLRAYQVGLGLLNVAGFFFRLIWNPMLAFVFGLMSLVLAFSTWMYLLFSGFSRSDYTAAYLAQFDRATPYFTVASFILFAVGLVGLALGLKYMDTGER